MCCGVLCQMLRKRKKEDAAVSPCCRQVNFSRLSESRGLLSEDSRLSPVRACTPCLFAFASSYTLFMIYYKNTELLHVPITDDTHLPLHVDLNVMDTRPLNASSSEDHPK
jgi:hypothetical protein